MAGFIYFVSGGDQGRWDVGKMAQAGLGHVCDREDAVASCGVTTGPNGMPGVLLSARPRGSAGPLSFDKTAQSWRRVIGTPEGVEAWCGHVRDARPQPDELRRAEMFPGKTLILGDGNPWLCPVGIYWDTDSDPITWNETVSRVIDWDDKGSMILGDVVPGHATMREITNKVWNARMGATIDGQEVRSDMTFEEAAGVCCLALAQNYRLGKAEVGMLGLLDPANVRNILNALIDWESWMDYLQKKTDTPPDGSCTEHGLPDDSKAIDQPSSTSSSPDSN